MKTNHFHTLKFIFTLSLIMTSLKTLKLPAEKQNNFKFPPSRNLKFIRGKLASLLKGIEKFEKRFPKTVPKQTNRQKIEIGEYKQPTDLSMAKHKYGSDTKMLKDNDSEIWFSSEDRALRGDGKDANFTNKPNRTRIKPKDTNFDSEKNTQSQINQNLSVKNDHQSPIVKEQSVFNSQRNNSPEIDQKYLAHSGSKETLSRRSNSRPNSLTNQTVLNKSSPSDLQRKDEIKEIASQRNSKVGSNLNHSKDDRMSHDLVEHQSPNSHRNSQHQSALNHSQDDRMSHNHVDKQSPRKSENTLLNQSLNQSRRPTLSVKNSHLSKSRRKSNLLSSKHQNSMELYGKRSSKRSGSKLQRSHNVNSKMTQPDQLSHHSQVQSNMKEERSNTVHGNSQRSNVVGSGLQKDLSPQESIRNRTNEIDRTHESKTLSNNSLKKALENPIDIATHDVIRSNHSKLESVHQTSESRINEDTESNTTVRIELDVDQNKNSLNLDAESLKESIQELAEQLRNTIYTDEMNNLIEDFSTAGSSPYYSQIYSKVNTMMEQGIDNLKYSPQAVRCVLLKNNLSFLPGYDPYEFSLKNLFLTKEGNMPKSYRTHAFMILEQFEFFESHLIRDHKINLEEAERKFETEMSGIQQEKPKMNNTELVKKLRSLKRTYYNEVIKNKLNKPDLTQSDLDKVHKEIKDVQKKLESHLKDLSSSYNVIKGLITGINLATKRIKEQKSDYEDQVEKLELAENQLSLLQNSTTFGAVASLDDDYIVDNRQMISSSKYFISLLLNSKMLIGKYLIKDIYKSKKKDGVSEQDVGMKALSVLKKDLKKREAETASASETFKKLIVKEFKKLEERQRDVVKSIDGVKDYHSKFEKLSEKIPEYWKQQQKEIELVEKIQELQEYIESRGVMKEEEVDFMISNPEYEQYEKAYSFHLNYMRAAKLPHEKENSLPRQKINELTKQAAEEYFQKHGKRRDDHDQESKSESSNQNEDEAYVDKVETKGAELFDPTLDSFLEINKDILNEIPESQRKHFTNIDATIKKDYPEAIKVITDPDVQGLIVKNYEFFKKRFELVRDIRFLEEFSDIRLAEIMARSYYIDENIKCMPDTLLIFKIFSMIKSNIIIEDTIFLSTFFKTLMRRNENQAKRLLILTYSQLGNADSMVQLALKLRNINYKDNRKEMDEIINSFATNLSITIEGYKDLTEFSKNLETKESGIMANIGNKMKSLFLYVIRNYIGLLYDVDFTAQIYGILDKLIDLVATAITFLAGLPFLKRIIRELIKNMILSLLEFVLEKLGVDLNDLPGTIMKIGGKIKNAFAKRVIESLDWRELIRKQMTPKDFNPDSTFASNVNSEKLETIFYEAATDESSIYNQTETIEIFNFPVDDYLKMVPLVENENIELLKSDKIDLSSYRSLFEVGPKERHEQDLRDIALRHEALRKQRFVPSRERMLNERLFQNTLLLL